MDQDHWFDALNKVLVRDAPRRKLLGAVVAATAGIALGTAPVTEAAKNRKKKGIGKGKRKKKGKGKGQPNPNPAPSCSGGACAAEPEWIGNQAEIDHCEFICRQCDGDDPRQFCIVDGFKPDGSPTKNAVCCAEGGVCCGSRCCGSPRDRQFKCCDGECVNTDSRPDHCGGCNRLCAVDQDCVAGDCVDRECPPGHELCEGRCVDTVATVEHCGGCDRLCAADQLCIDSRCVDCPAGEERCGGVCVDTNSDPNHCGGCDRPPCTGIFERCCDGECVNTRFNNDHCGNCRRSCPAGWECCNGYCIDPQQTTCCRDRTDAEALRRPLCNLPSVCSDEPCDFLPDGCCLP